MGAVLYEMLVGMPPFYTDNIQKLYKSIQKAQLQIPSVISRYARDLLQRMLNKKPSARITINQMKQHPFFKSIDWNLLVKKRITPPVHLSMEEEEEGDNMSQSSETAFLGMTTATAMADNSNNIGEGKEVFVDNDY